MLNDVTAQSKNLPKAEIKMYNGATTLFINGVPNAGLTYMTGNPLSKHFESFGKIGVDLVSVSVTADFSVYEDQPIAWLGADQRLLFFLLRKRH